MFGRLGLAVTDEGTFETTDSAASWSLVEGPVRPWDARPLERQSLVCGSRACRISDAVARIGWGRTPGATGVAGDAQTTSAANPPPTESSSASAAIRCSPSGGAEARKSWTSPGEWALPPVVRPVGALRWWTIVGKGPNDSVLEERDDRGALTRDTYPLGQFVGFGWSAHSLTASGAAVVASDPWHAAWISAARPTTVRTASLPDVGPVTADVDVIEDGSALIRAGEQSFLLGDRGAEPDDVFASGDYVSRIKVGGRRWQVEVIGGSAELTSLDSPQMVLQWLLQPSVRSKGGERIELEETSGVYGASKPPSSGRPRAVICCACPSSASSKRRGP